MAQKRSPICFVAMAFGHHDTDAFYDMQILPILRKNNIRAVIINRRQSNDDLNIQIIEQINSADLCIVDLTYARPSVYFEAGFAQKREIPVIYTVRADHLDIGQPDNLRVHFDLQMKPIIAWADVTDRTFSNRIEKRIKSTFLISWNNKQEENQKYKDAEEQFLKLPSVERFIMMRKTIIKALKKAKFVYWHVYHHFLGTNYRSEPLEDSISNGLYNHIYAHRIADRKMHYASIHTFTSPSKSDMLYSQRYFARDYSLPGITQDLIERKSISVVNITFFILSFDNITSNRIENTLQTVTPTSKTGYYRDTDAIIHIRRHEVLLKKNFMFLSGIKSSLQLEDQLASSINRDLIDDLENKKSADY